MNLVLISGTAPGSHDPRGGQWIIQSWGLEMIQQDRSGIRSAFGSSSRRCWLHLQLCNWPEACIVIQPDSHPNEACETGPSPGRACSPGRSQALGAQGSCSCRDGSLSSPQKMRGGMRATLSTFILSTSSSSSEARSEMIWGNQKWLPCHSLLICCLPSW